MARKRPSRNSQHLENNNKKWFDAEDEFEKFHFRKDKKQPSVHLTPRGDNQKRYVDLLQDDSVPIVIGAGVAGTGKTMLATQVGVKGLLEGKYKRIVITRPAVSVDEQHGFLPGTLDEKMQPWVLPILDVFYEYYTVREVQSMINNKMISIEPLSHMRGRTFKNSFIICDEMQNSLPSQMKMVLTRIGEDSKMAITGDLAQHDRTFEHNGLGDFTIRVESSRAKNIQVVHFTQKDIQRHQIITDILNLYGE